MSSVLVAPHPVPVQGSVVQRKEAAQRRSQPLRGLSYVQQKEALKPGAPAAHDPILALIDELLQKKEEEGFDPFDKKDMRTLRNQYLAKGITQTALEMYLGPLLPPVWTTQLSGVWSAVFGTPLGVALTGVVFLNKYTRKRKAQKQRMRNERAFVAELRATEKGKPGHELLGHFVEAFEKATPALNGLSAEELARAGVPYRDVIFLLKTRAKGRSWWQMADPQAKSLEDYHARQAGKANGAGDQGSGASSDAHLGGGDR